MDSLTLTGISDYNTSFNSVTIFPNPTSGQITITSSINIDEIKITDLLGRVIYHTQPNKKNISVKMDREGVYFVSLTSSNQTITRKLIVQR